MYNKTLNLHLSQRSKLLLCTAGGLFIIGGGTLIMLLLQGNVSSSLDSAQTTYNKYFNETSAQRCTVFSSINPQQLTTLEDQCTNQITSLVQNCTIATTLCTLIDSAHNSRFAFTMTFAGTLTTFALYLALVCFCFRPKEVTEKTQLLPATPSLQNLY